MFNLAHIVVLWLCALNPCTAHTVDPPPPVLPPSFSQRFSMSDGSQGRVLYDDSTHQQRLEHVNNTPTRQNQCYFWYNTTADCTEYFTPGGDVYVWFPEDGSCCLEACASGCREPSTPLPAPDFASACAYRGVVTNATHSPGRHVKWYSCPATFEYFVDASTDVPVAFATADKAYVVGSLATIVLSRLQLTHPLLLFYLFPLALTHSSSSTRFHLLLYLLQTRYVVWYDTASFDPAPQPPQLFVLPTSCSSEVRCNMTHPVPP
jgi:hypothetical protein